MASTPTIFPTCNRQDHSLIPNGECATPASRGIPDLPIPASTISMATSTRSSYAYRNSVLASDPPAFSLASQVLGEQLVQLRQRGYPRLCAAMPLRTHIPAHIRVEPLPPCTPLAPVDIMYTYVIKIAEGEWPSNKAREPIYIPLDTQTILTLSGNKPYSYSGFLVTTTFLNGLWPLVRYERLCRDDLTRR